MKQFMTFRSFRIIRVMGQLFIFTCVSLAYKGKLNGTTNILNYSCECECIFKKNFFV